MKKFYFMSLATAALLASCSSNDELPAAPEQQGPAQEEAAMERIILGTSGLPQVTLNTRAGIVASAVNDLRNSQISLFGLAEGAESWSAAAVPQTAAWIDVLGTATTTTDGENTYNGTGESAKYGYDFNTVVVNPSNDNSYFSTYYPRETVAQAKNYRFYGVYPAVGADAAFENAAGVITITDTFTGEQDILTGMSDSPTDPITVNQTELRGWNAPYLREWKKMYKDNLQEGTDAQKEAAAADMCPKPIIAFNHKTTQVQVVLKRGTSYNATLEACMIKTVGVQTPTTYVVTINDQEEPSVEFTGEVEGETINFANVVDETTARAIEENPENDTHVVFVKPNQEEYYLQILFGEEGAQPQTVKFQLPKQGEGEGTTEGYAYTLEVSVTGPEQIIVKANLTEWKKVDEKIEVEF